MGEVAAGDGVEAREPAPLQRLAAAEMGSRECDARRRDEQDHGRGGRGDSPSDPEKIHPR
jgi:hypothetical protein